MAKNVVGPPPAKGMNFVHLAELITRLNQRVLHRDQLPGLAAIVFAPAGQDAVSVVVLGVQQRDVGNHVGVRALRLRY